MAKRSWPHPVLDVEGDDYPDCAFQAAIQIKQTRTIFTLQVQADIGSQTLLDAITDGTATYVLQVHCPRTSYREAFKSGEPEFSIEIPDEYLRDIFTVRAFIVAARSFSLSSSEFNPVFKGMAFAIEPGFVLAIAPPIEFEAEKSLDDLKTVRAICYVIQNSDPQATNIDFDLNQQRIAIVLPADQFKLYGLFKNRQPYSQIFVSALVLPAICQGLIQMREEEDEGIGSTRWRRILKRRVKELGKDQYELDDAFSLAQDLLETPFARVFRAIEKTAEEQE